VQKKDDMMRFCIDYRKVKAVTEKDAFPLPRIDDTLDTLSGSQWFSTLDMLSGYWQVEMDQRDGKSIPTFGYRAVPVCGEESQHLELWRKQMSHNFVI